MKEFFKYIASLFPKKEDALDAMLREQGKDPDVVLANHHRMREAEKSAAITVEDEVK